MTKLWNYMQGWKMPLLALIGFIFALVSVLGRAEVPPKMPMNMPPLAVFEDNIAGIGVVEPKSEVIAIGTELPGVVREIHVKVGEGVKKGEPLFSLDQRDINAQIISLEATLRSAKIQAEDFAAQFKLIEDVSDNRAIAKDDYNRRKYASALSKARIDEIKAQLNQARITKERLTVTAPIDGTLLDVNIRPGEFASAGNLNDPLMRIGDLSTLHVRAEFDEEIAAHISKDAPVYAYKRGDTSKTYALRFVRFEPYITPKQNLAVTGQRVDTRVMQVIYALPSDAHLLSGQQMDVYVQALGKIK